MKLEQRQERYRYNRKKKDPSDKAKRFGGWLNEEYARAFERLADTQGISDQGMAEILMMEALETREKGADK